MKRLSWLLSAVLWVTALSVVTGCQTSAERANAEHQREKLEKPQPPPRL